MADIELVVKIPREKYIYAKNLVDSGNETNPVVLAIGNGTPLPKGYGDLVDFDKLCEEYWDGNYMEIHKDDLPNIKPIIKADKAETPSKTETSPDEERGDYE